MSPMAEFRKTAGVAAVIFAAATAFSAMSCGPFTPAVGPTNAVSVSLDVRPRTNMCLVKAEVNGRPCTLLFDTGASHTTLNADFVRQELPDVKPEPVALEGATNVKAIPHCFQTATLKVGDAVFRDFTMMTIDLNHLTRGVGVKVDGILGMNVIACVPTEVSLAERRVTFGATARADYGKAVKSTTPNCAYLETLHEGKTIRLLVDCGSTYTFFEKGLWRSTSAAQKMSVTDVNGRADNAPEYGVPGTLDLGMPIEVRPMIGCSHGNLLGADTLLKYDLFIDFPALRFRKWQEQVK